MSLWDAVCSDLRLISLSVDSWSENVWEVLLEAAQCASTEGISLEANSGPSGASVEHQTLNLIHAVSETTGPCAAQHMSNTVKLEKLIFKYM